MTRFYGSILFVSIFRVLLILFLLSSLLSTTIQAFETLLYPFNWPHTYIPVLPSYLIEMCDAPTPYIIGLMRSCKNDLAKYKGSSDMLIVDLDKQKFIFDTQNDMKVLPESTVKSLKIDLYNLIHCSKLVTDYDKNVELCRIFVKIFVKTVGTYANFIVTDPEPDARDEFKFLVSFHKAKFIRPF